MSFFESAFLWKEAVISSAALAAACAVIGTYAILRRVVFLPAALSQISGLGVVLAFLAAALFPALRDSPLLSPFAWALAVTLGAALVLGGFREPRGLSREAVIGMAYVTASALIIAVGARVPQESHAVDDVLFGNAVMASTVQMVVALSVSAVVLLLHGLLFHPFMFVSFDTETAKAQGLPVRTLDAVLFLSMGLVIAVATKTVGAMPVFAFSVLPPAAALHLIGRTRGVMMLAPLMGAAAAFVGYYISFILDLPTGACTVGTAAGFYAVSIAGARLVKRFR